MKATILQENLNKALSFVSKIISAKTQLPILANVLLEIKEEGVILSSTNLETGISLWVGASTKGLGKITVPAKVFSELVASFNSEKIDLEIVDCRLKLLGKGSELSLSGIDAKEFPPQPEKEDKKRAEIDSQLLVSGLPFVLISASNDESRPLLTGVKIVSKNKKTYLVATDGYRLSVKELPEIAGLEDGFVVSAKALLEVCKLTVEEKKEKVELFLSKDKNQVIFSLTDAQISTRLIEGEYPAYEKIIPENYATKTEFNKTEITKAVKLAAVYAREASNILKLKIEKNQMIISANTPQLGENKVTIDCQTEGEEGEIAFNVRFLQDLLSVFPEEQIVLETNGALSPGVFKTKTSKDYLHIIMPVRIQG